MSLARRLGRLVLVGGAVLLVLGVGLAAHAGATGPWPLVPGLAVAGAGLSFLIIPLANVVLAAVPAGAAGGASGLFGTAQQLGGAIGVAAVGTVFFARLDGASFTAAFTRSVPLAAALFAAAAALALVLPRTAVADEEVVDA